MSENEGNHEGHESHEEHDDGISGQYHMRLPSPLTPEAEQVMTETIGCAIAVHRALGPGFLESIYRKAMHIELHTRGLKFEERATGKSGVRRD